MKTYKLADSTLLRVLQIVQEAFATGVDFSDIMRQLELEESPDGLVMTQGYIDRVKKQYAEMDAFVLEQQAKQKENPGLS
jgi:hypothetical protein